VAVGDSVGEAEYVGHGVGEAALVGSGVNVAPPLAVGVATVLLQAPTTMAAIRTDATMRTLRRFVIALRAEPLNTSAVALISLTPFARSPGRWLAIN